MSHGVFARADVVPDAIADQLIQARHGILFQALDAHPDNPSEPVHPEPNAPSSASVTVITPAADPHQPAASAAEGGTEAETRQAPTDFQDLVTLDQAAAAVHRTKRTLEHYKTKGTLPAPTVEGGGGKPDLWDWKILRPWLEETFRITLPETYPANRKR